MTKDFLHWVAPGLESSTEKHLAGQHGHDQKTHGRWAGNKSGETSLLSSSTQGLSYTPQAWDDQKPRLNSREIEALTADARANGGFTYKPTKGYPKNGFAVAVYPQNTAFVNIDKSDKKTVEKAFKDYYSKVVSPVLKKDPDAHWGAWYDTDSKVLVFDMSRVVKNVEDALRLGREHKQKAIWDIEKSTEIPVPLAEGEKYADDLIREGQKAMKDPGRMTRFEFDNKCDPDDAWKILLNTIGPDLADEETEKPEETETKPDEEN